MNSWIVGIRRHIDDFGELESSNSSSGARLTEENSAGMQGLFDRTGWVPTCPGATDDWAPGAGRLLTGIVPLASRNFQSIAFDKDHLAPDTGRLKAWLVQVRKKP